MRRAAILGALTAAVAIAGSAQAATPLAGVCQVTIKGKVAALNGTWLLSFASNGAYAIVKEPNTKTLLIGGTSAVSHATIAFHDKTGPLACTGKAAVGKYSWNLSGKTLRLARIADACSGRTLVLTSASLTKVG